VTAEPKMDELLASIRKAIQEDNGEVGNAAETAGQASGSMFHGAMRELKVRMDDELAAASNDINEIRNRAGRPRMRDPGFAEPQTGGRSFADILSRGEPPRLERLRPAQAPEERPPDYGDEPPQDYGPVYDDPPMRSRRPLGDEEPPRELRPSYAEREIDPPPMPRAERGEHVRRETPRPVREEAPAYRPAPRWRGGETAALPPPRREPAEPSGENEAGTLISPETSVASSAAFGRLAETLLNRSFGDRPPEDVARDLLRPLLTQWLDDNLPALVERLVREEIERVARRGR